MKKLILFLGLLVSMLVLAACGTAEENDGAENEEVEDKVWADIQERGEIVVGTAGTLFPASYYPEDSDELTGYNVEVFREIADRLDVDIKFEEMAYDAMLSALQSGRVDIIQAGPREESREKFAFSEPVKYSYVTMIVRADDLSGIETLEDLEGKVAGGAATTVYSEIARKYGAEVKTYGNVTNDAYLRDVANGNTDVVINDYYLQSLALTAFPELNITLHPDLKMHPTTNNVVMKKEATVLLEKINEIVADMKEDGTLTELSAEFFGGLDVSKEPDEEIIEIEGIE
ncbi:transporter substrate-binding domain-containing protein [Ornithinibacillus sp. L9]|uniref:Transporter substrate-binding domain-containing protein n=1 Tax=Ornithinibacillus caprae TaxID=2678566 RepID=A0A6N8FF91_9BACI|nr:transporter substrate-binding domain-containing protein [Ornithinibacillus caprae]MUK88352.1 transporter substrate-binding domain-containing protein [Ornithinibacillus caprae]